MENESFNPLKGLFDLAGQALNQRAAKDLSEEQSTQPYGVDEYGRAYLRGTPSAPGGIDPRLVLGGVVAIAVVIGLVLLARS